MTWIIEFRGDLSEESPLNMDGSTSLRAVSLVLGDDLPTVLTNLLSYTKARGIAPTTINRCEDLSKFTPTIEDGYTQEAINNALKQVNPELPVYFTYAISSEAEDDDDAIFIGTGS